MLVNTNGPVSLTQEFEAEVKGKVLKELHPVTYVSGLFHGSQLNWAALTKEAYTIYLSVKKLAFYIADADITLRSDHLPLKRFLLKNTLNDKVNNWAVELETYRIKFEHIKGDTLSRLISINPDVKLEPELVGYEFGQYCFMRSFPKHPVTPLIRSSLARSLKPMMQISLSLLLHTPFPCPAANCMGYKNPPYQARPFSRQWLFHRPRGQPTMAKDFRQFARI